MYTYTQTQTNKAEHGARHLLGRRVGGAATPKRGTYHDVI